MRTVDQLLSKYGESHQNPINKAFHWICVPAIVLSLYGLLWAIPLPETLQNISPYINFATLVMLLASIYYFRLSVTMAILMILISIPALMFLNQWNQLEMPIWQISLLVFVVAWVGQFIGHKIEGKKPSFIDDLKFLLIGPLWLLHFILKKLNIPY